MSAGDLCTNADIEAFLSLNAGQDSALIASLITAASAFIDSYTNRSILSANYTETRNGIGSDRMMMRNTPITAVTSVTIDDKVIPLSTKVSMPGYTFDDNTIYLRGYEFTRDVRNVVIVYTAGYSAGAIVADIKQVCVEIVSAKYKRRLDIHVSSKVLDGQQITFNMSDVPPSTKIVLDNLARSVFPQ